MSALGPLRALASAGLGLARRTTLGRMGLAHVAELVDPAVLPAAVRDQAGAELARWRVVPEPVGDVEKLLAGFWGARPGEVLDEFDAAPVVVTVGAQVHRGVLDGEPVAVKVLRPGLAELVRADLKAAEALAAPLGGALPRSDPGALLREVTERLLDELDLEHEGASQRTLARALRRAEGVAVPAPVSDLTHPGVLVRAWVDGVPLASAPPVADPEAAATALLRALAASAAAGIVHCDPEPGNVLVGSGGLALIDAGASARMDRERLRLAADALRAVVADDAAGFAAALSALGWVDDADVADRLLALAREIGAPLLAGPVRLDAALLGALADAAWARLEDVAALAPAVSVVPGDLWPLRGIAGLALSLARLEATLDWPAEAIAALSAP